MQSAGAAKGAADFFSSNGFAARLPDAQVRDLLAKCGAVMRAA
jgi:hypothetical protein